MTCLECVAHPKKLCRVHGMTSNHDIDDDEQLRIRELETDLALMAEENTKLRACVEAAYIPFSVREATQSPVAYLAKPKAYLQKIQEGYANAHRAFIEKQAARIAELEGALGEAQEHLYSCVPATGWGLRDQGADADRKEVLAKLNAALASRKGGSK